MDRQQQLRQLLNELPSKPFRVVTKDGRTYEVRYPRMNLLAETYIKIGIPDLSGPFPMCDHTEYVGFSQIDKIELIPATSPTVTS